MITPEANEAAMRYLAAELERAHLMAAQAAGNLTVERLRRKDAERRLAEYEEKPGR